MYETNVAMRRPPHSFNAGTAVPSDAMGVRQAKTTGAAATAWIDILTYDRAVSYVVMRFDGDCYVSFSDGTEVTAASTKDWIVKAGEVWEWLCCGKPDRYMRMMRAGSSDVTCTYYLSDQPPNFKDITFPPP